MGDFDLQLATGDVWSDPVDCEAVVAKMLGAMPLITATELLLDGAGANARLERPLTAASLRALQSAIRRRRLDVSCHGPAPIVFTAPHTLELHRDDEPNHKPEDYTGTLALRFAEAAGGACITWSQAERGRVRATGAACASNRDPNYLRDDELPRSPWFAALRTCRERLRPLWSEGGAMGGAAGGAAGGGGGGGGGGAGLGVPLHVDVHGIRDPPAHRADCMVGSAAMRRHLGCGATDVLLTRVEARLLPLLAQMPLEGAASGGPVADRLHAGAPGGTPVPRLGGDWGGTRNTLTQLSTDAELFASCGSLHYPLAIQVELSLRLRKHLNANRVHREAFARALASIVT